MIHRARRIVFLAGIALVHCGLSSIVIAQEYNGEFPGRGTESTDRLIVQWVPQAARDERARKLQTLAHKSSTKVRNTEPLAANAEIVQLERRMSGAELEATVAAFAADPQVEFAAPDLRRYAHAIPNDALVSSQWYLLSTEVAALRAETAWDVTTGSAGTVIAVLDTGVRFDHPDLLAANAGGKLLPGYDFVSGESSSSFVGANDGDGRDADPSDPGDWVDQADLAHPGYENCEVRDSSWHGTRVAGVIAARTNNGVGIAGAAWNAWILPVRVLGKCGGRDSDIIAGMRWAAGLSVPGIPDNPHPANIINLSLGSNGPCTAAYQSVANELAARGVLVVASAGNEGGPVSAPANCPGILGVAGVRQVGTKVGFSNLGREVSIAAPGGNCVNTGVGQPCLFSIVTATNLGRTSPGSSGYTDEFNFNVGTSFSAPMVAGAAALMHAVNGKLGSQHFIQRLRQGASPFPANPNPGAVPNCRVPIGPGDLQISECYCTTETCGAGLLNAHGAVTHALRPVASIQIPTTVSPGQSVSLDGSGSAASCKRTIVSYRWSVLSTNGATPQLSSTDQPTVTVTAPAAGEFTLRLTVTDDTGAEDSAEVTIGSNEVSTTATPLAPGPACSVAITIPQTDPPASDPAPSTPPSSGGGGGGGQLGWELLALLLLCLLRLQRRGAA